MKSGSNHSLWKSAIFVIALSLSLAAIAESSAGGGMSGGALGGSAGGSSAGGSSAGGGDAGAMTGGSSSQGAQGGESNNPAGMPGVQREPLNENREPINEDRSLNRRATNPNVGATATGTDLSTGNAAAGALSEDAIHKECVMAASPASCASRLRQGITDDSIERNPPNDR